MRFIMGRPSLPDRAVEKHRSRRPTGDGSVDASWGVPAEASMVPEVRDGRDEGRPLALRMLIDWDANHVMRQMCLSIRLKSRDSANRSAGARGRPRAGQRRRQRPLPPR